MEYDRITRVFMGEHDDSEHLVGIAEHDDFRVKVYTVIDWPEEAKEEPYILAGDENEFVAFWKYSTMEEQCSPEKGVDAVIKLMEHMLLTSIEKVEDGRSER